jgi:hypothetical protein
VLPPEPADEVVEAGAFFAGAVATGVVVDGTGEVNVKAEEKGEADFGARSACW